MHFTGPFPCLSGYSAADACGLHSSLLLSIPVGEIQQEHVKTKYFDYIYMHCMGVPSIEGEEAGASSLSE